MKVKIKRLDKSLPLPEYKTAGAVAFDFYARLSTIIPPHATGYVPLNVIIAVPAGHVLHIYPRSGTHKKGLLMANGVGVIDTDFCGADDEIHAAYYNPTDMPVTVERGERIAQGIIKRFEPADWEEVDEINKPSRGGFGSTGAV